MNTPVLHFRQITFLGGPLNGEQWPIEDNIAFLVCGQYTYTTSKDDKSIFTPGGMSTADTRAAMRIEQEFSG